jgi:Transposase IS66 family
LRTLKNLPVTAGPPSRSAIRSRPIVDNLEPWLREKLALISQKTKLADAIRLPSRWQGLTRFISDGRIEIDSDVVGAQAADYRASFGSSYTPLNLIESSAMLNWRVVA